MIHLTAIGMCSSLGRAAQACAATRAGLARRKATSPVVSEIDVDPPDPRLHQCPPASGFQDFARLTVLLREALEDALGDEWSVFGPKTELIVVLPHLPERPALYEIDGLSEMMPSGPSAYLVDRIVRLVPGLPDAPDGVIEVLGGHAAVFDAMSQAVPRLQAGETDRAIVCAVDSLVEPLNLSRFSAQRRLVSPEISAGFFPAEGAAVLVIETEEAATRRGVDSLAILGPTAYEPSPWTHVDDDDEQGERFTTFELCKALEKLLRANPRGHAALCAVLNDCNGEPMRASHLWSNVQRLGGDFVGLRNTPQWSIADSFGDVGAATGAFQACVASRAFSRGYAGGRELLLCATSDRGDAGGMILSDPRADS